MDDGEHGKQNASLWAFPHKYLDLHHQVLHGRSGHGF